jgi:hypothetical protein
MRYHVVLFALAARLRFAHAQDIATQAWPSPTPGVFSIPNFSFDSGETLDSLDIHYQTLGKLEISDDGRTNAVHIMHGSIARGDQLLTEEFAGSLFNAGQILDADKYFIILRDGIGHGNSSGPRNTGPKLPIQRYGPSRPPAPHRASWRQPYEIGDGGVHGRDAHLDVGRDVPRLYGCTNADSLAASGDRRTQQAVEENIH